MSFYQNGATREEQQRHALASLPLPEAALVIDVRQSEPHEAPLLRYLATDLEDLAMEMRANKIPRWRYLAQCIDFLRLDAIPPYVELHEASDFVLTTRAGQQIPVQGLETLAGVVGRDYLDCVRNARISAIKDSALDPLLDPAGVDPQQPTVRVFFLVDIEESASLSRAASYAHSLKVWVEQTHGLRRFNRAECIQTVAFCLNAHASVYHDILVRMLTQPASSALDTVLLLQTYSDDEAYIGGNAQIYHAELILYTLLLRWPDVCTEMIEDPRGVQIHAISGAITPPCPTYTMGVSALEYSARWASRWLDYGVVANLLETINDARKVDQEGQALHNNIRKWLNHWWQEIRATVPSAMAAAVDDLQAFDHLGQLLVPPPLQRPGAILSHLDAFRQEVSECYTGNTIRTLQYAMEHSSSLLDQFNWKYTQMRERGENDLDGVDEPYQQLAHLYTRIRRFLPLHFQGAAGAVPRAVSQLAALTEGINEIREAEQRPPDLLKCRTAFERQAEKAYEHLQDRLKTYPLPGLPLRSTVISLLVVILIGLVVLIGVNWYALLPAAFGLVPGLFIQSGILLLGIKTLFVLLLIIAEVLYLSARNRSIQREYQKINAALCRTAQGHLMQAGTALAAQVALTLLQWADLYAPGDDRSPNERRLRDLVGVLKDAQKQAADQQALADSRRQLLLEHQASRPVDDDRWPGLNNRKDLLAWHQIEEALLQSCNELQSNTPAANMLSEMLLRRLGRESSMELLEDTLHKYHQEAAGQGEARFDAIGTLLVSMALSSEIVRPEIPDVLPLLKQYTALKDRYLQEPAVSGVMELQGILRETMLEQVRTGRATEQMSVQQSLPPALTLAAWVGRQRTGNPQLAPAFERSNVLDRLAEHRMEFSQVLDTLRNHSTLLGRPDEIAGDNYYYLLLAPGAASEALVRSFDPLRDAQVRPEIFPDGEKLVYFHLHRIRQIVPGNAASTRPDATSRFL